MRVLLVLTLLLVPAIAEAAPSRAPRSWEARTVRTSDMRALRRAEPRAFPDAGTRSFRYRGDRAPYAGAPGFRRSEARTVRSPGVHTFRRAAPSGFRTRFFRHGSARTYYAGARTFRQSENRAFRTRGGRDATSYRFRYAGTRLFRHGRARTSSPAASGAVRSGAVVIGDSIAHGVRGACRCAGRTRVGATPRTVLGYLRRTGSLSGRSVILSSGASNAPRDLAAVEAQLAHLRRSGARVSLLGVGPRFGRLNPRLAAMAARHGARFMPIGRTRDGVHPASYGGLAARGR